MTNNCTDCFSGCVSTTSDKCVKYTGNSIEFLGITTGDTLESVELAITDYLATVLDGTGISPTIDAQHICDIVDQYLPATPTLIDILTAIIRAICDLVDEIEVERTRIDVIEDTYDTACLTADIDGDAGTHAILQEVITELCTAIGDITVLQNLYATCITTSTINTYIQAYLTSIGSSSKMYTKMVPYAIYPFYPTAAIMAAAFDINGVGMGDWENVYLCNGYSGLTPDLRGRSIIGTTSGMGSATFDPEVDPGLGNPSYSLGDTNGVNSVTLSPSQIAAHTHVATSVVTDPGHTTPIRFDISDNIVSGGGSTCQPVLGIGGDPALGAAHTEHIATTYPEVKATTGITVDTTIADSPAGSGHDNVHPVLAMHYIMYIP